MRTVFVVPSDNKRTLSLELRLVFRYDGLPKDIFEKSVESFHHSYAPVLSHRSEARQDVHDLAPYLLEVLALELFPLVDDDVLGLDAFVESDPRKCGRHFFGRRL